MSPPGSSAPAQAPPSARVFLPALREVERGLALPVPDRIRILREVEADLEALHDRLVAGGLPSEEARRRALEVVLPGDPAIRDLVRAHAPLYRRLTGHLEAGRLRLAERTALGAATATVLVAETAVLLRADLLRAPSPFLWLLLGLGALLFAVVLAEGFRLWIKGEEIRTPRPPGSRGAWPGPLALVLGLSAVVLAVGVGGTLVELYLLAGILAQSPERLEALGNLWLLRVATLLSVAILLSLAGGLAWLVLSQWRALVSEAHRTVLGLD